MNAHVYIVKCADGSYYTGISRGDDLSIRIAQHNAGTFGGYTSKRRPVILVWSQWFDRIDQAICGERQLKGWSRAKKEALIAGRYDLLPELAKSHSTERTKPRPSTSSG